jgi:hypothetical protein
MIVKSLLQEGLALGESEEERRALGDAKARNEALCRLMKDVLDEKVRYIITIIFCRMLKRLVLHCASWS